MARFLIVYGTTEGHTRTISERIGEWLVEDGHTVEVLDSAELPDGFDPGGFDGYIVAGSLHETRHQKELTRFVREHAAQLQPSAFLSSSLTAIVLDDKHQSDARKCMAAFEEETGWKPTVSTPIAGALPYSKYNWFTKMLMRKIVEKEGGDTDTSRDYEYTDWEALKAFVKEFAESVVSKVAVPSR